MPKQTFYHLPKDKQETLMYAAKKEFSRVPLHKASIANIIKSAGIPRGSFYQYFEDKEDLYYFLLNEYSKRNRDRFISILEERNGDLFDALIEIFQVMIQSLKRQENRNFFRNTFLNMNYKLENTLTNHVYEENQKKQCFNAIDLINTKHLNIEDEQELHHVLKIIKAVTIQNLVHIFVKDLSLDQAIKNYTFQIELLKKGLYKK